MEDYLGEGQNVHSSRRDLLIGTIQVDFHILEPYTYTQHTEESVPKTSP